MYRKGGTQLVSRSFILVSSPRFWVMGNHLAPFPEASDWPEGQEHAVQAVGGQGALRRINF